MSGGAEPQYARPAAERRGYLERVLDNVRIASPDGLHGAASLAPLAGLDFPALHLLADANDAAIAAGAAADLGWLSRLRRLTEARLSAELAELAELAKAASPRHGVATGQRGGTHAERLAWLALRGELWTAEVLLGAGGGAIASIAPRLRRVVEARGAHLPVEVLPLVADVVSRLEGMPARRAGSSIAAGAGDARPSFLEIAGPLAVACGVEPLRDR